MKTIVIAFLVAGFVQFGVAEERFKSAQSNTRNLPRNSRPNIESREQIVDTASPLREIPSRKPYPVDGASIAEIRKAEPVGESEKQVTEDITSTLPIPLPNTMDGLNDKRPLGIGDKLSFRVVEDEGNPRTLSITDSGEIDVPYIGRVPVENRTCKQFAQYIKKLLEKDYYYQATVIVGLDAAGNGTRAASRGRVYVMGQVRSAGPQEIPVDEVYTVSMAILRAGGFGPYANKRNVKVVRGGKSGETKTGTIKKPIYVDCAEILDKGHWDKDVEVGPNDIITVPEKMFNFF